MPAGTVGPPPGGPARGPHSSGRPAIDADPRPPGRGLFVAFEGGEGTGKSTQVRLLFDWLGRHEVPARITHEPGGTPPGARIRALLLDPATAGLSPRAEALLYAADRAHHVAAVVRPALDAGEVVVTDRFVDSSLAYQGAGRTLDLDEVRRLSAWATGGLVPDLTVLLDLPAEAGLARALGRAAADRLESESLDFHERVRATFRDLAAAEPGRYLVLDAARPAEDLATAVRERVAPLLPGRVA
ncbi:dTMP kinase [Geodermatophilus bullaregiensis]|uniref:dTMP kinase n=1 Tax=Geodermatophilus bullaregiensis TaxID=1564160 RepID=UPI0027DCD097|nr:dTMP kinase [Geodermatophilus bullaregiensis]MBM7807201.1 dTMP kinase [Geodermatophilus bullaregiensis]